MILNRTLVFFSRVSGVCIDGYEMLKFFGAFDLLKKKHNSTYKQVAEIPTKKEKQQYKIKFEKNCTKIKTRAFNKTE